MGDTNKKNDLLNSTMSLGDHLEELRLRLILALAGLVVALIISLFFGKIIITFLEVPYIGVMGKDARLQSLSPADGFISYMNISLVAGVIMASPWIFYQLWKFVSAGLYLHEKRYVRAAVFYSVFLFIAGAVFFMFVIAPVTLRFLVLFNKEILGIDSNFTFKNYISFVTTMMLVFGLAFQTPIAIFFLNKMGIVTVEALRKSRKFVVLGIIVIAAVATPGSDLFSLFTLAIPIYLLFELGIFVSHLSDRKKNRRDPYLTDSD